MHQKLMQMHQKLMRLYRLIRLALSRGRSHQQCIVKRLAQTERRLNVSAQVRHHDLIVNKTLGPDCTAIGREGNTDNPIHESEGGSPIVKNERGMSGVANRDYTPFVGARVGIVCHDGSCRVWEWDEGAACFVPIAPSSP